MARVDWNKVASAFEQAIEAGVMPGATVQVRVGGDIAYEACFGSRCLVPQPEPMRIDTVFDLSSLTKPLATTVATMYLVSQGKLRLDDRVTRFFHNFGVYGKNFISFRHILAHCSGLPAYRAYYVEIAAMERKGKVNFVASRGAREYVYQQIHREKPERPPGVAAVYSDLGFIVLGEVIEETSGMGLDRFLREKVYRPLGLRATDFIDISLARSRRLEPVREMFAATEQCPFRKRLLVGEVHDNNAYAMGGVAGHAGLFAPVREVGKLAAELVACWRGRSSFLPQKVVAEFWQPNGLVKGSTWALGWDTPSPGRSSAGRYFSPGAVGHLGFTGTSLWIEPQREVIVALLTNRVHPHSSNQAIKEFRPRIHDLIMETINGA
jgi:CubicO group peptidase (beta-lactamase class C family)